ncbi:hypothetical protein P4H65_04870 [Paenibacillus chitinolyticus]|uniref:hypothetical protein n=1 Tax=Paenibacillus chitinolyticus TaxID=79263 RepID=UPI002DBD9ACE|nr:hypothetical protein [Paenibacillus chitinolyticus]MEC0245123.1 hypothetical protein [Paenibacillus chitinolyticus]
MLTPQGETIYKLHERLDERIQAAAAHLMAEYTGEQRAAMRVPESLRKFKETVSGYIRELDGVSLEQLLWKPSEDQWSLGQISR